MLYNVIIIFLIIINLIIVKLISMNKIFINFIIILTLKVLIKYLAENVFNLITVDLSIMLDKR